jgi:NADPH:quinone reductase-like Zn-dependent oxidoreductase
LRPIIDSTFPIADAALAHMYMEANRNAGKIVLTWG